MTDAYGELQKLLLEDPDVVTFLGQVAELAAAVVPALACGITMRREGDVHTAASSGPLARRVDEIQYGRGQGPCLQSLHTGRRVHVRDLAVDENWPDYRPHALAQGVVSSLSLPLTVQGRTVGALNLYGDAVGAFDEPALSRAAAFSDQTATALTIVIRHADAVTLEQQLREAMSSRTVIDQAIGVIAGTERISSKEAFARLRQASQESNRKLRVVAEETIQAITGHPYEPPRPFTQR